MGRPAAEGIAEFIADIREGRTNHPAAFDETGIITSLKMLDRARRPQPVVDCTAIYQAQRVAETIDLYDDHPSITPPWEDAFLCYENSLGNITGLQVHRTERPAGAGAGWATTNDVDWSRVRWVADTAVWIGGRSGDGRPVPTSGPCHMFRHAIYDDGSPADINWLAVMTRRSADADPNLAVWETAMVLVGASLNFLNASNVDIAEPVRDRPVRRRIARTGVTVQTIVVRPPGRRRAGSSAARPIDAVETELSPVRGHFAHYGDRYNRGRLFGKYEGKFWIPGHVRGAGDTGETADPRTYVLAPIGKRR